MQQRPGLFHGKKYLLSGENRNGKIAGIRKEERS